MRDTDWLFDQKGIYKVAAPFLIVFGDGTWRVAREIFPHGDDLAFVEPFAEEIDGEPVFRLLSGPLWHVGESVWEARYATQIMTLDHPDYHAHPAWALWIQWLKHQAANTETPLH